MMRALLLCLGLVLLTGLALPAPQLALEPWPEADALFHQDPRWKGGDDAYSVDLGRGRVLWLFGDSFVGNGTRAQATMVRNSVAIQSGYDPSHATIQFSWAAGPSSFFAETPGYWYWPGDGTLLEDHTLLVFLMKIRAVPGGVFGFEACGWDAAAVSNPGDDPSRWKIHRLNCPPNPFGVVVGSGAVLCRDGYLYAFGSRQTDAVLMRWPMATAERGDLSQPEQWTTSGWSSDPKKPPAAVLSDSQTEFSVHYQASLQRFVEIQTVGFGAADVAMRTSAQLTGPWSGPEKLFHPPESDDKRLLIYAGKAHPEQQGADWVLTYVANSFKVEHLFEDDRIYFPRFLRSR